MKRTLLIIVMALLGIGLFAYPAVSNYIFARNCSTASQEYDDSIAKLDAETKETALQAAKIYNENLEGNPVHDPFLKGSGMVMADNYFEVLNQNGDGIMGYISIPKISVKIPIYHGTAEATLLKGVGHLEGSSMPIGGVGTHSVITGHTGLANAKMFTDLVKLAKGDEFYLHILDQVLAYKIDQIEVVLPEDTELLKRISGGDYSTLVTCTPYGINSHRLLVRGTRTEYVAPAEAPALEAIRERFKEMGYIVGVPIGAALVVVVVIIVIIWRKKKKKKDEDEAQKTPAERSDNPWATTAIPMETPGGTKPPNSPPSSQNKKSRPKRRRKSKKFWWEENRD